MIKEFLGVYDNLQRALDHAGAERSSPLGQGVEMILGQFMGALKRCGVERVDATPGVPFDPTFHEAVGQEPHAEIETGGIVTEMQAGFVLNGRLVRASMVTVSQGPMPPVTTEDTLTDQALPAIDLAADKPKKKKTKSTSKKSRASGTKTETRSKAKKPDPEPPAEEPPEALEAQAEEPADEPAEEPATAPTRKKRRSASRTTKSRAGAKKSPKSRVEGEDG